MKTSPRTSLVLATTLIAGGVAAGSVSSEVLKPTNSNYIGNAGSFFGPLKRSPEPELQASNAGTKSSADPVTVATNLEPTATPESGEPIAVRLALEPSTAPNEEPSVTPAPTPVNSISPSPESSPSVSPDLAPEPTPSVTPQVTPDPINIEEPSQNS